MEPQPAAPGVRQVAGRSTTVDTGPSYEAQLDRDPRWALSEGSRHFEGTSAVFDAVRKIARRLDDLKIPYAVVGGMALFEHGYRRTTDDVDILVTKGDLKTIHDHLEGLGYRPPHPKSKHLRDTENGVRIEFLTTGDFPGDGKEKPVAFPDPAKVSFESEGIKYIELDKLIELKLASGISNASRLRDLSDVMELIRTLNLPVDYAERLDPSVREKYDELWRQGRRRYVDLWRNKWLTSAAETIQDMSASLRAAAETLEQMGRDGVIVEPSSGISDDYALLVTTDPDVAEKYGMIEESEYWGDAE